MDTLTRRLFGVTLAILMLFTMNALSSQAIQQPQANPITYHEIPERPLPSDFTADQESSQDCLVPCDEIVSGGPPPDGIPPVEDPVFYSIEDAQGDLLATDVILGVQIEGQMYGFPHNILNWHEIINQRINDAVLSITYCPLTGTGIPFHTGSTTLGTSGNLYENNLVYYDRETDSYWSQMYGMAIKGEKIGETHEQATVIETTFDAFSAMYPDAQVLTRDTGHSRNYDSYPYSRVDYLNSEAILFETKYDGSQEPYNWYHPKDLTLIINSNNNWGMIPYGELSTEDAMNIVHDNNSLAIFYDEDARLAQPFYNDLDGQRLEFTRVSPTGYPEEDSFNLWVYEDQLSNVWNMKGEAIAGPNEGDKLIRFTNSYTGFWFAATSFFGEGIIYQADDTTQLDLGMDLGTYEDTRRSLDVSHWFIFAGLIVVPVLIRLRRR